MSGILANRAQAGGDGDAKPRVYSFRAISGPVIRSMRGRVEAIIPREETSPPTTMR